MVRRLRDPPREAVAYTISTVRLSAIARSSVGDDAPRQRPFQPGQNTADQRGIHRPRVPRLLGGKSQGQRLRDRQLDRLQQRAADEIVALAHVPEVVAEAVADELQILVDHALA
jgi:hypothetical protein